MNRSFGSLLILIVGIFSLVMPTIEAHAEKRVALIVGNAQYANVPRLQNPANDATDLANTLKGLGYDVLFKANATKNDFGDLLADFARKADGADVALFYYAGHGVQYQHQNYLLPTDIDVRDNKDVAFKGVKASEVVAALDGARHVKVLVLDACRDNPFAATKVATRSTGLSRGLGRIDQTDGMIVLYATAPDAVARDGVGRNSPFAEALINRLKEPGVEINNLFRQVAADVYDRTDKAQRPEISGNLIGEFFLNPNEGDAVAWDHLRDSQDPADFHAFIKKFPNSHRVRDAQNRIDTFQRIAALEAERLTERKAREEAERRAREENDRRAREEADRKAKEETARKEELARKEEFARREEAARREEIARKEELAKKDELARKEDDRRRKEQEDQRQAIQRQTTEKATQEAEQKRKEDEAKRAAALLCETEDADLKRFSQAGNLKELEAFGVRATCAGMNKAASREINRIKVAQERACARDADAMKAASRKGLAGLKTAAGQLSCDSVVAEAKEKIAALENEERVAQATCASERQALSAIDSGALDAKKAFAAFKDGLKCAALTTDVDQEMSKAQARAKQLQTELARVGCYDGRVNGQMDDQTKSSIALFVNKKGLDGAKARLTDDFISTVKSQELLVCSNVAPVASKPQDDLRDASKPAPELEQPSKPNEGQIERRRFPKYQAVREPEAAPPPRPVRERPSYIQRVAPPPRIERAAPPPRIVHERAPAPVRVVEPRQRPAPVANVTRAPRAAHGPVAGSYSGGGGGGGGGGGMMHGVGF